MYISYLESPEMDPDFIYQECCEDEPFIRNYPLFPPRPALTPFPQSDALPAKPNAVTLTNLHLALHPVLYQHDEQLYSTSITKNFHTSGVINW